MEASSSSKVTVEYHDPSVVFPLISRELTSRLPLRNLNWQSHARPLRQIKHLHVEFVPSQETQAALRPQQTTPSDAPPNSIDILRSGFEAPKPTIKERRHQIPGLKTTPYLKIYVLRCDDKEWYKEEERRKLKEWVRNIKNEDGRHEHHDAFEWLIIHVVIPDTIAASEPRWRESSRDPDELKERSKAGGKLLGKSTKTVLDRLREDFNDGKSGQDHIAQIRLSKNQIAVDLLPVPALARTVEETADEREKSWSDLMTKIRASLLSSFDSRVRQYEDDITEQEARRSFPGWNFCTFFIHKEGLAKALESVGLLEDALAIYDELSLGLETVLSDIASGEATQTATSFSTTGTDVVDRIIGDQKTSSEQNGDHKVKTVLQLFNKDYREEILRSAISVFDFFCYLFERQTSLILRLAGRSSTVAASGLKEGGDDLVMLAEACWRGLSFIHNGARTLKQDLQAKSSSQDAQSLALSWTYAAADFVLTQTQSTHLDLTDDGIKHDKPVNGNVRRTDFGFSMGADAYPQRNSSLPFRKPATPASELKSVTTSSSAGKVSEDGFFSPPSSSGNDGKKPAEVPGLAELAAYRAELVALQRKSLDALAATKGWYAGWAALSRHDSAQTLTNGHANTVSNGTTATRTIGRAVASSLRSRDNYLDAFELLTETAVRHYLLATHNKTAENLMGDLAVLKYYQQDFEGATAYFEHALPMLEADGWHELELKALTLQTESLGRLGRLEDAVKCSLELTARSAAQQILDIETKSDLKSIRISHTASLRQAVALSERLSAPLSFALSKFFANIELDNHIDHFDDRDGFRYRLHFQHVLQDIEIQSVSMHLVHVDHPSISLTMSTKEQVTLRQGRVELELESNVSTFGMFTIAWVDFKLGNLIFRHDLRPKTTSTELTLNESADDDDQHLEKRQHLLLYPALHAFNARISLSRSTAVHKAKHIAICLDSGRNDIISMEIRLKPGSAGLRLYTDDVVASGSSLNNTAGTTSGHISLGPLSPSSSATVHVRFSLEQLISELSIRAEVLYTTAQGSFTFTTDVTLATKLPLDVEVKEAFHLETLLSTFTMRTTSGEPVVLNSVSLHDSDAYAVECPAVVMTPTVVLAQQPVDFVYRIKQKSSKATTTKQKAALEIDVECVTVSQLIVETIASRLSSSLLQSQHAALQRLIVPTMISRCQTAYTNADLSLAALLDEAKVPSFADLGWYEVVDTLPSTVQRLLSDWLMKWHIDNQRIMLDRTKGDSIQKRITIAVDVPTMDHTFLASLKSKPAHGTNVPEITVPLGETVPMQLDIRYTRQWGSNERSGPTKSSRRPDFMYALQLDSDLWMASGRNKSCFTAAEPSGTINAEFTFVPLKPGIWPLPTVTIRPVLPLDPAVSEEASHLITIEATCTTAGQVVHVTKNTDNTRLVIGEHDLPVATPDTASADQDGDS